MDLLTIGDSAIDLFMKIDPAFVSNPAEKENPEICFFHGSKVPVEKFGTSIAGNAVNVAVACSKMGLKPGIYTELGDDANGDRIIQELENFGVNTDFCIKNKQQPTNVHAIIVSGKGGERTIFSYHEKRDYKLYNWPTPKWLFYSSLAKGFQKFQADLVNYLKSNPQIGVVFNPGTQQLREGVKELKNFLEVTDILFVNKEEAKTLTNSVTDNAQTNNLVNDQKDIQAEEQALKELHKDLQTLGPKLTVITQGAKGATAFDGKVFIRQKAIELNQEIVDKTGAGDAFTAGFVSAIHFGKSLRTAMKWGAINSSHKIRFMGTINGLLTKEELEAQEAAIE